MKKLLSIILALTTFVVFSLPANGAAESTTEFKNFNDPALYQFIEDQVYSTLSEAFDNEDYIIENVNAIYISQEYLDEVAFNSQSNIFFGYTLEELISEFKDTAYIFTLGDNDQTIVKPFEQYDDTYDRVIRNIAIGTGVILICVTVSVATAGVGLSTVSMVFSAAAKSGTIMALSSGTIGAVAAGAVTAYQTGDVHEALKAAAYQGSEEFKWGAIIGSITGGYKELIRLRNPVIDIPSSNTTDINYPGWRQAEIRAYDKYGGTLQSTYLNGEQVSAGTAGATRPDIVRNVGDHIEAIEVKYYNLAQPSSRNTLYRELEREISNRTIHLPENSTQRIVLDVTNWNFDEDLINSVENAIWQRLDPIYPNIPIDIIGF